MRQGQGRVRGSRPAVHSLPDKEHLLDCFADHVGGALVVAHLDEDGAVVPFDFERGCFQLLREHDSDMMVCWAGTQDMGLVLNYRVLIQER